MESSLEVEPAVLLTRFIGHVPAPIQLAPGISLGNLNTSAEIEGVAKELIWRPSHMPPMPYTLAFAIVRAIATGDEDRMGLPPTYTVEEIARLVSAESLVIRYDYEIADAADVEDSEDYEVVPPKERRAAEAFSLCQVLSLLISEKDKGYWGWNLAYQYGVNEAGRDPSFWGIAAVALSVALNTRSGGAEEEGEYNPRNEPSFWEGAKQPLEHAATLFDGAARTGHLDTLLYAGDVLHAVSQTYDPRFKLVLLVSIFEMLLTHNPDFGRFNVEDSISRQFVLKASVLLRDAGARNLEKLRADLRRLYDLRSAIAHGDFSRVRKTLKVPQEREHARVSENVSLAYSYLRLVLWQFLKDPAYVGYLKAN